MRQAKITVEITETKTEVTVIGTDNGINKTDITGTDAEKSFIRFLKKLRQEQQAKEVLEFIKPENWHEVK